MSMATVKYPAPPPMAPRSELELVAAVLQGRTRPEKCASVEAEHFTDPQLRVIWEALASMPAWYRRPELEEIARRVRLTGWRGPLGRDLLRIIDEQAALPPSAIRRAAADVVECYRQRRLLRLLDAMVEDLRSRRVSADEACILIAGHIENAKGKH